MGDEKKVEKKARAPQTGMSLEMDVMKKIAHQLGRLDEAAAAERVLEFVQSAVRSTRLKALEYAESDGANGQLAFP
jgi:hypothetical protein